VSLFGNNAGKVDSKAAAAGEASRLLNIPLDQLAAESLPAFGPDGVRGADKGLASLMVANWLLHSFPGGTRHIKEIQPRVREAVQRLELAGLVLRRVQNVGGSRLNITSAGLQALRDGSTAACLGGEVRA